MGNGLPRASLRQNWGAQEHFQALDDDIDKLQSAMEVGFDKVVDQLEKNRRTWRYALGVALGVATLIVTVIGLVVNNG